MGIIFDIILNFVDYLIDLVLSDGRKFPFRRKGVEWFDQTLTVAHQVQQFDIFVSTFNPDHVRFGLVQVL